MNSSLQPPQTFPLTAAQKAIWLDQISQGESPLYNISSYLELNGPVSAERMQRAVEVLVAKHDALRLSLLDATDAEGVPLQLIAPSVPVAVPLFDVSEQADPFSAALALMEAHMSRAFSLTQAPLLRFFLIKLDEAHWEGARAQQHERAATSQAGCPCPYAHALRKDGRGCDVGSLRRAGGIQQPHRLPFKLHLRPAHAEHGHHRCRQRRHVASDQRPVSMARRVLADHCRGGTDRHIAGRGCADVVARSGTPTSIP